MLTPIFRIIATIVLLFSPFLTLNAQVLNTGDMAFTAFNSDGPDNLAMVTFVPIAPNTTVYVTDRNWDGAAFATNEGLITWNSGTAPIAAGTIIVFDSLATAPRTNIGTVVSVGSMNLTNSGDGAIAFQGTSATAPTRFLAAITNGSAASGLGSIANTGMTEGSTCIVLQPTGADIAAYSGARTGLTRDGYLAALNTFPANWQTQDGTGDQQNDGIVPDIPFSTTAFAIVASSDVTPPSVTTANLLTQTTLKVIFSENITRASALTTGNYTFTPTLTVSAVSFDSLNKTAVLTMSPLTVGTKYRLSANGLVDLANNTQTVASSFDSIFFNNYAGNALVISEIMYNIGGTVAVGDSFDFVEIYNNSSAAIPLGGLELGAGVLAKIGAYSLAPRTAVCIAADTAKFRSFYNVTAIAQFAQGQNLSNSGEPITIVNSIGTTLDTVRYDDTAPWTTVPDGNGPSLEIVDVNADNNVYSNWLASITPLNKRFLTNFVFCSPGSVTSRVDNEELNDLKKLIISPNPTNGILQFNRLADGVLTNAVGQTVLTFTQTDILNLQNLPEGIYFVVPKDATAQKIVLAK